jgi:hypothetical protein
VDGLDVETVAWMNARLTPTPLGPSLDVVPTSHPSVAEVVAFCSATPTGFPSTVSRSRMDERGEGYHVLECGHDAPMEAPHAVADLLLRVAAPRRDAVSSTPDD